MNRKRNEFIEQQTKKYAKKLLDMIKEAEESNENWSVTIERLREAVTDGIDGLEENIASEDDTSINYKLLPKKGVLAKDKHIVLRLLDPSEKEYYLEVFKDCAVSDKFFDEYKDGLWDEFISESEYVCSIYDVHTSVFIGYCSIKNLCAREWELAIELLKDKRNKGYGTSALNLFMDKISEITGARFFKALVDVDNEPSQKLCRSVGGYPDGLAEYMLHGKALEEFRNNNLNMIDDHIIKLAEEFVAEPEELIGMVLQYRFDRSRWKK